MWRWSAPRVLGTNNFASLTAQKSSIRMTSTIINHPRDPNTLSNYHNFRTTHTDISFDILFTDQKVRGTVTHTLTSTTAAEAKEIILDTSHVNISNVKLNSRSSKYDLLKRMEPYGSALRIKLDGGVQLDKSVEVKIDFETTESCTALQWLTPAQTSNKKHPYMFSQCQAIHARSIFPCQDTPDIKATFDFTIRSPLPVIASGVPEASNPSAASDKPQTYRFKQAVPIPSYLFAVASGDIAFAKLGPRTLVASGPDELQDCKWELERDTERYVELAEKIVQPYEWGIYGCLVLPPSFPYGGMENPIFTFVTPTVISGDRENVDVIAHELSHSWSGNLVSNCSWEHFWLNEGWTTYLERRLQMAIHGDDPAYRDFSAIIGWTALSDSIEHFGVDHEFTKLVVDLKGKDPDDAFSTVPYEKGFTFLYYIEKLVGIEKFNQFIPHYFRTWRRRSLDSYDFKQTLLDFFASDAEASAHLATIDWDTWFYKPGYPPKPVFDTRLVDVVYTLADNWTAYSAGNTAWRPSPDDISSLRANQLVVFLEKLLSSPSSSLLSANAVHELGTLYALARTRNTELSARYLQLALKCGDLSAKSLVADLLSKVGRMKFVRPLYRVLVAADYEFAVETFERNKDFYHPICRQMIVKTIFGKQDQQDR